MDVMFGSRNPAAFKCLGFFKSCCPHKWNEFIVPSLSSSKIILDMI